MLLIDGVKYELRTPSSEDEFEQVVKEHAKDIFGEQSIYLDRKQKLKSLSGIGSIPDGYVILFGDSPHWHIIEVELSSHPLDQHIVAQVSRFITGIRNLSTQREIAGAIYNEIIRDAFLKPRVEQAIQSNEIYKFLADLISKSPILTIIIEKDTGGLTEAISTLAHSEIRVVEFQTFIRTSADFSQHAHLFEPLGQPPKFLAEVRKRFAEKRPTIETSKVYIGYCYIPIKGHKKIHTEWLSWGREGLRVELHLERDKREENLNLFNKLKLLGAELESKIGEELIFDDRWHKRRARLYTKKKPTGLTDEVKEWAVETMIKFYDVFKPLLDKIDT